MRVLFIEDDAMNRRVVADMLAVADIDLSEADRAEAGLRLLDEQRFDVVLLDLRMPGMDGLTALRQIRSKADATATVPIIIVTADMSAGLKASCLTAGADDVLFKPVAMNALFESIGAVMARRGDQTLLI